MDIVEINVSGSNERGYKIVILGRGVLRNEHKGNK